MVDSFCADGIGCIGQQAHCREMLTILCYGGLERIIEIHNHMSKSVSSGSFHTQRLNCKERAILKIFDIPGELCQEVVR